MLTHHREQLVVWDKRTKVLGTVTSSHGSTATMLTLGDVADVVASGLDSGDLYIVGTDGRITALTPAN